VVEWLAFFMLVGLKLNCVNSLQINKRLRVGERARELNFP